MSGGSPTGRESSKHWDAKTRLQKLLFENDYSIKFRDGEISFPLATDLGEREYWPDLLVWKEGEGWICFEVDGPKGHSSHRDMVKMKLRDGTLLEQDIRTVRIKTGDLVGRKKQTDSLLLEEIDWQLR